MFDTHQYEIGRYARYDARNMFRVITFVLCTIQQQLNIVEECMEDIDHEDAASIYLWGWKREAFMWYRDNKDQVYRTAMDIYDAHPDPSIARHELLKYFASLPGLGLVKGGFVIQLCFGLSGCIDRHNVKRFNIPAGRFKAFRYKNAKTNKTRNAIVREYHAIVDRCGGTASLWDTWCNYLAAKTPSIYKNGYAVSKIHMDAIF